MREEVSLGILCTILRRIERTWICTAASAVRACVLGDCDAKVRRNLQHKVFRLNGTLSDSMYAVTPSCYDLCRAVGNVNCELLGESLNESA